jgi:GH25 family lysozyme M1 (1,4-beta-N-acetylmuramidase)
MDLSGLISRPVCEIDAALPAAFYFGGVVMEMEQGFDISSWQDSNYTPQKVDFETMKQHGEFVIIRQGYGMYTDEDFRDYWRDSKPSGLLRMVYHFLTWDVSPEGQAEKFFNDVKNDLPDNFRYTDAQGVAHDYAGWVADFEWWDVVPSNVLDILRRFMDRLCELILPLTGGKYPGIYTAPGFWGQYGSTDPYWSRYWLWSAQWRSTPPDVYKPWSYVTMWQNGTPPIGIQVGVESKDIDSDKFLGEKGKDDLFYFKNGGNMSSIYESFPTVLYMDENSVGVTAELMGKYDLIISKGVVGTAFFEKFVRVDLNLAQEAGKPILLWFEHWADLYVSYPPNRPDLWGGLAEDQEWKTVKRVLFSGSALRRVHGVIINASKTDETGRPGINIPDTWISQTAEYQLDLVNKGSGLPTFLYMDKNPLRVHPNSPHIIGLIDRVGISTYSAVPDANLVNGFPPSEAKPDLAYWGQKDWTFWLYDYTPATRTINGIFRGTKEMLYALLRFSDPGTEPPPPPPPPPVDETEARFKSIEDRLLKLETGNWKYQP